MPDITGEDLIDELKLTMPTQPTRRYGTQTGQQFFTDANIGLYGDYINPYLSGGSVGDLAGQYASSPVVSGYWETGADGVEGAFTPTSSLMGSAEALNEVQNLQQPADLQTWLANNPDFQYQSDITQVPGYEDLAAIDQSAPFQTLQNIGESDAYQTLQNIDQSDAYQGIAGIEGSDPYTGISGIIGDMGDTEGDMTAAEAHAAMALGFTTTDGEGNTVGDVDAYRAYKESNRQSLDAGIMGQSGVLGTDYETAYNRETVNEVQQLTQANAQMIESLGMRSSVAAFSKMSEVSSQISNLTLQRGTKLMEQDLLMRQAEYEALLSRYNATNSVATAEKQVYLDQLKSNRLAAIEGYGTQLNALLTSYGMQMDADIGSATGVLNADISSAQSQLNAILSGAATQVGASLEQNKNTISAYQADLTAMQVHADTTYKGFMAQLGYDEHVMAQAESEYEAYMAPYYDQLDIWWQQAQLDISGWDMGMAEDDAERIDALTDPESPMNKQEEAQNTANTVWAGIGTGAGAGFLIGGPAGAFIGGVLGLFGGLITASVIMNW